MRTRLAIPLLLTLLPTPAAAQGEASRALASWLALDAPPGDEVLAAAVIRRADPRWSADAQGNPVLPVGAGGLAHFTPWTCPGAGLPTVSEKRSTAAFSSLGAAGCDWGASPG